MLGKKGGRGFPHLVWLDAKGDVIAEQSDRSVSGFDATGARVLTYVDLKKKFDGGDKSVQNALFLADLSLGKSKYPEAKKTFGKLKLTEQQLATAGPLLLNIEVTWRQGQFPRISRRASADQRAQARAKAKEITAAAQVSYLEHHNAKRFPTDAVAAYYFSNTLIQKAIGDKDVALFEGVYGKLKKLAAGDSRFSRVWPHLDAQLAKLKTDAAGGSGF